MKTSLILMFAGLFAQTILAAECKVTDKKGTVAGVVKDSGSIVTTVSGKAKVVGSVDKGDNIQSSFFTQKVGRIGLDGSILDFNEDEAGSIDDQTGIVTVKNDEIGKVSGCDLKDSKALSRAKAGAYLFLMLKPAYRISSVGWSDQPDIAENNFQLAVSRACPGFPSYDISDREVIYNSRHALGNPRAYSLNQRAVITCFHYAK